MKKVTSIATMMGILLAFGACVTDVEAPKEEGTGDGKADAWDHVHAAMGLTRSAPSSEAPWAKHRRALRGRSKEPIRNNSTI